MTTITPDYEHIRARHESGQNAATIATEVTEEGRTRQDIDLGELHARVLRPRGMLIKNIESDSPVKWTGSVMELKKALQQEMPQNLPKLNVWLAHITDPKASHWHTTETEHAQPFWQIYKAFHQSGLFQTGDLDAIYELGGGRIALTTEQAQKLIEKEARRVSEEAASRRVTNAAALAMERIALAAEPVADAGKVWAECWEEAQDG